MYDSILLPTDGSDSANAAYEHAVAMAEAFDATLHVLYVVNTSYQDIGATGKSLNSVRETGRSVLSETRTRAEDAGLTVETHLEEGEPYQEIVDRGEGVDVIVMATRGRSGIDRYLLGSVTEKVVRTSETPVFTVRGGDG